MAHRIQMAGLISIWASQILLISSGLRKEKLICDDPYQNWKPDRGSTHNKYTAEIHF